MSPRGQGEGGGPCGLRGIWASWNVKETEPRAPSPQSKSLSKAVEKLLASQREGSMLSNSVYNALEAWPAGPQRSSCGKNGRQLLWQGSREGSSLPTTAGPEESRSLERQSKVLGPVVPLVQQILHPGEEASRLQLRPTCHGPPGISLWAKDLPDVDAWKRKRGKEEGKGKRKGKKRVLSRTMSSCFPQSCYSQICQQHISSSPTGSHAFGGGGCLDRLEVIERKTGKKKNQVCQISFSFFSFFPL